MYGDCFRQFDGRIVLGGGNHHFHKLVIFYIEVDEHFVIFIKGSQRDGLRRSVDIIADVVSGPGDSSVERGTDIAVAEVGACRIQFGFRVTDGCLHFLCGRLGLQYLYLADGSTFGGFFHPLVIAAGIVELRFGGFKCRLGLGYIILISVGLDHEDEFSLLHFAAGHQVGGPEITVYPGHQIDGQFRTQITGIVFCQRNVFYFRCCHADGRGGCFRRLLFPFARCQHKDRQGDQGDSDRCFHICVF